MEKILIATPCLDQKVDAYYTHSLCESIKLGQKNNFDLSPVFLANESILPMARNELLNLAYSMDITSMVFIDDDEKWNPACLIEILQSPKDIVSVPVVNKTDTNIDYNIKLTKNFKTDPSDGYIEAYTAGAGFLKISKKAIIDLWESNEEITFRGRKLKNICEYTIEAEDFVGEDITLSKKIKELGYTIWVNPKYTAQHIGNKIYSGDFQKYLNQLSI